MSEYLHLLLNTQLKDLFPVAANTPSTWKNLRISMATKLDHRSERKSRAQDGDQSGSTTLVSKSLNSDLPRLTSHGRCGKKTMRTAGFALVMT
jgi:hypothetical protein